MNNKYKYKKNKYNNSNYIQNRSKPKKKRIKTHTFSLKINCLSYFVWHSSVVLVPVAERFYRLLGRYIGLGVVGEVPFVTTFPTENIGYPKRRRPFFKWSGKKGDRGTEQFLSVFYGRWILNLIV